jgi:hypothetical protein
MAGGTDDRGRTPERAEVLPVMVALAFAAAIGAVGWFVGHEWGA